jgi:hypothetical protein
VSKDAELPGFEEVSVIATTDNLQRYARLAGVAMLVSIVFGTLGEAYIPGRIFVGGDGAETAANLLAHPTLFRVGFATYLVEGICDVALAVFFYILLRPVDRNLALLSAFFGMAAMLTYATAESSYLAASLVVRDASGMGAFSPEQRNALVQLAFRLSGTIAWSFLALYGIATMIRGYLIIRSGYIPAVFGVLFVIAGLGFFMRTATHLLAPSYSQTWLLLPMAVAGVALMLWFLIRGVRRPAPTGSTPSLP